MTFVVEDEDNRSRPSTSCTNVGPYCSNIKSLHFHHLRSSLDTLVCRYTSAFFVLTRHVEVESVDCDTVVCMASRDLTATLKKRRLGAEGKLTLSKRSIRIHLNLPIDCSFLWASHASYCPSDAPMLSLRKDTKHP